MKKLYLLFVIIVICAFSKQAVSQESMDMGKRMYDSDSFIGFLFRPEICISKCSGTVLTFGAEAGWEMIGFGFRYGYKDSLSMLFPDIRVYYDIQLGDQIFFSPQFEITPQVSFGSKAGFSLFTFQLAVRPGLRVRFSPSPNLSIYVEPFMIEFAPYTYASVSGNGKDESASSSDVVIRYSFGIGGQARF